jgi:hypothetical protein
MLGEVSIVSLLLKVVQGVQAEHKECVDRICFDSKAQKR